MELRNGVEFFELPIQLSCVPNVSRKFGFQTKDPVSIYGRAGAIPVSCIRFLRALHHFWPCSLLRQQFNAGILGDSFEDVASPMHTHCNQIENQLCSSWFTIPIELIFTWGEFDSRDLTMIRSLKMLFTTGIRTKKNLCFMSRI